LVTALSVSGKAGYMSRNSFQERRLVLGEIKAAFLLKFSARIDTREKRRESLIGCPFRAGQLRVASLRSGWAEARES